MNKIIFATMAQRNTATLLIHCPDSRGIIASVTQFLETHKGNVVDLEQHTDLEENAFFMRVEWELDSFNLNKEEIKAQIPAAFADKFNMKWRVYFSDNTPKMALFVSKMSHCMYDILARYTAGEWNVEIPVIISNHENLREVADKFGIEFHCLPITKENKLEQEAKQLEILEKQNINFIVLARYMQIVTEKVIDKFPNKIINIHHSFLPAFVGAKPYHSAHKRGVKIIGATSHYVTTDLDEGPIIEQDVVTVSHKETIQELVRKGRDNEKIVLSRAIRNHIERKCLVYKNRTIVFA
jgi:formyltetrahydrofolate deformylase